MTCLQGRQPREPRSPGGRQDQPHPSTRPCLRAQAGKGGRGVVQLLRNRLYWKNPIYIQTLGGPALAQLAGGGSRSAGSLQLAWGSGSGGGELPPHPAPVAVPSGFPVQFCLDQRPSLISASASPAPPCPGGPRSLSPLPLPCRDPRDQRICPSVCPADYLPRDPACPSAPSPEWAPRELPFPSQSLYSGLSERGHIWNLGATGEAKGSLACPGEQKAPVQGGMTHLRAWNLS